MGTYLSTPVTDKGEESGETSQLAWGVVDMQGWRKNMEDAHVAQTDVPVPSHLLAPEDDPADVGKVFGVFDGHGGPEVARFCQLYIVSVLTQQPTWRGDDLAALENAGKHPANTPVGHALIQAFHAMDRLINDPLRRDEIIRLRAEKPMPGEHRLAQYVPAPYVEEFDTSTDGGYDSVPPTKDYHDVSEENNVTENDVAEIPKDSSPQSVVVEEQHNGEAKAAPSELPSDEIASESNADDTPTAVETEKSVAEEPTTESAPAVISETDAGATTTEDAPTNDAPVEPESTPPITDDQPAAEPKVAMTTTSEAKTEPALKDEKGDDENDDTKDDDSNEAVGKEEAAELDQDMMDGDTSETSDTEVISLSTAEESSSSNSPRGKVTVMFQKLLSISGQVVVNVVRDKGTESDSESDASQQQQQQANTQFHSNQNAAGSGGTISRPSAANPTIIHNGRQICNLPDHPIHAGCTAVVAVLIGRTLTIANAGDSRAVLCRAGGRTEALSFDHKPLQEREMRRITNAGGFVNQFGRVNGNLNLSRSIGDLKYKQVPGINPAGQMITAEPDIIQVVLDPLDEFFVLGCDGIWDCLTNEQAVAYVRERIDSKTPTQIGVEMLDEIISEDPRASQGIGGDNMTVMIVDLLPHTRSHRSKASS